MESGDHSEKKELTPTLAKEMGGDTSVVQKEVEGEVKSEMQSLSSNELQGEDKEVPCRNDSLNSDFQREDQGEVISGMQLSNNIDIQGEHQGELPKEQSSNSDLQREKLEEVPSGTQPLRNNNLPREEESELQKEVQSLNIDGETDSHHHNEVDGILDEEMESVNINGEIHSPHHDKVEEIQVSEMRELKSKNQEGKTRRLEEIIGEEKEVEPVFDGTEDPDVEAPGSSSTRSSVPDPETPGSAWPDKAVALKNFVREKSVVAVSSVIRRLSGRKDEDGPNHPEFEEKNDSPTSSSKDEQDLNPDTKAKEVSQKSVERSTWNPLSFIKLGRDADTETNIQHEEVAETPFKQVTLKGRILLYTRLGCQDCREVRLFLHQRNLRYVEINIDVYPSRKMELEKYTGSSAVPVVFFNKLPIGGLSELKDMDESGKLKEKIDDLMNEEPSREAPVPPLSGEDDESCSGMVDEWALLVRKMRESIMVKDRFCRMRRFSNCFVGSEAVDFLSEDQYLERKEAIEFGQKLAGKHFFRHIFEENVFEDGNHLYRFLDHDPFVFSQCYNIPRGIIDVKPKPIIDIASRLRFLSLAMFEAYTSVDGKHVDYRSIHGSEEFARYLRVVEELQRVEMQEMSREEKLAFFINLYNMMAIHAILLWGYPVGALERRKMLGDFKYVIGGYTYSLSAIENGILRSNQRPPYNLVKPFGVRDQRAKVALPYPEPLIHFALVSGNRSGPALRCFSPSNIDKELMEAARTFLRDGGFILDPETKVALVSKLLRWYSADFGKNEVEVLKHAANYLETEKSEELLELLANTQLKVVYQPYDWGVNC